MPSTSLVGRSLKRAADIIAANYIAQRPLEMAVQRLPPPSLGRISEYVLGPYDIMTARPNDKHEESVPVVLTL